MNRQLFLIIGALAVLGAGRVCGVEEKSEFAAANQAYSEARFQEAAAGYESVIQAGKWNATLFYDLGNAYYRLGNFGKAILNYERALALEPRHPEAQANLRLASDEGRALELRKDWIERYAAVATVKQYTIAVVVTFWLALFIAAHLLLSRRRSAGGIALIALSLIVCGTSIFAIYTLENGTGGNALAVVTAKEVEARLATADNAKSVLLLPAGSEIRILSERGDWVYAALPNDQRGWIPAASAERVRL
jgi:tetratricopeptide (TPR) repeat protein